MTAWYNLTEEERIKNVYSAYKIQDFWNWWSDGFRSWMEIRTIDWKFAKEIGKRFFLRYSHTGVFVNNHIQLRNVIAYARDKQTIWFGIQPRKYGIVKNGNYGLSGGDNYIDSLKFIFVDIDRKKKDAPATAEELEKCDKVAEAVLAVFDKHGWKNSYIKIASGNGLQLLIKLDIAIKLPEVEYCKGKDVYGKEVFSYITNANFEKAKKILYETIGQHMASYVQHFMKKNGVDNVEIDRAGFRIAQVGALPVTKNYKYDGFRWRGIVDMKTGINRGLSDYIFEMSEHMEKIYVKDFSGYSKVDIFNNKRITSGLLRKHKLIKFMLENELPAGGRNNKLWFQIKCLIRDYGIDMKSDEFRKVHAELEAKHGSLPINVPEERFHFDVNIVNSWFIENMYPPLYEIWPNKIKHVRLIDIGEWSSVNLAKKGAPFEDTDIRKNMADIKKWLKTVSEEDYDSFDSGYADIVRMRKMWNIFLGFVGRCVATYGLEKTKYYYTFLFDKYFNYE